MFHISVQNIRIDFSVITGTDMANGFVSIHNRAVLELGSIYSIVSSSWLVQSGVIIFRSSSYKTSQSTCTSCMVYYNEELETFFIIPFFGQFHNSFIRDQSQWIERLAQEQWACSRIHFSPDKNQIFLKNLKDMKHSSVQHILVFPALIITTDPGCIWSRNNNAAFRTRIRSPWAV